MNTTARYDRDMINDDQSMKGPVIASLVFHAFIFILTAVGLPFVISDPLITNPVSVEIVDIAEITQTNKVAPPKPKEEELAKPKPPEEKPAPPEMKQERVEETPPEPAPIEKPVEKKAEVEKPKPKVIPPKAKPKTETKEKKNDFQSLLKNLAPVPEAPSEVEPDAAKTEDNSALTSMLANLSDRLTVSELDAFKQQIEPCWVVPAGAKYAEDLAVEIRVSMNRDMTVRDASILDQGRYNRDTAFRAAADSAMRALRNPRCSPLKLPADKYDQWNTIMIRFDPKDML